MLEQPDAGQSHRPLRHGTVVKLANIDVSELKPGDMIVLTVQHANVAAKSTAVRACVNAPDARYVSFLQPNASKVLVVEHE